MAHWLNEEHTMIRDAVRRFAENEIAPLSQRLWEEEAFPYGIWKRSAELGFTGLPYPESYSGGGGSWLSFVIVLEEMARVDCAVANSLMANSSVASLLNAYGTDAQKKALTDMVLAALKTKSWQESLEKNDWTPAVLSGPAFAKFVDDEFASLRATMVKSGMV